MPELKQAETTMNLRKHTLCKINLHTYAALDENIRQALIEKFIEWIETHKDKNTGELLLFWFFISGNFYCKGCGRPYKDTSIYREVIEELAALPLEQWDEHPVCKALIDNHTGKAPEDSL